MGHGAVAVVGAGSWGTTVSALLGVEADIVLWSRSADVADAINVTGRNPRYLEHVRLPPTVRATASLADAVAGAEVVLVAVPSHGFRGVVEAMAGRLRAGAAVVSLAKGLETGSHRRMSEIAASCLPDHPAGVLSGPTLAHEVAAGHPAAAVVAFPDAAMAERVQLLLHGSTFRVYTTTDVVGCEVAGAAKNVMAIAAGIADGLGFGENTRAVLVTRGLAELTRLGVAAGGKSATFAGLAGVGDLVATCTSWQSRNRMVGLALGGGQKLDEVLAGMHMVAEGVGTARPLVELAAVHGVEVPIAKQVAAIVAGETTPAGAVAALMERPARAEPDGLAGGALG